MNEGRASHSAVVNDGHMWIFGGYSLKQELLYDFIKYISRLIQTCLPFFTANRVFTVSFM